MQKEKNEYFKMIKKRLANNNYNGFSENEDERNFHILNDKRITIEDYQNIAKITNEIIASNDCILNPLDQLIVDKNEFNSLDEIGKQRYMLQLSSIYIDIKNKISKGI